MFNWKNSIIYRIITGKSPIEPDINKNIGYNALKSIETVPDGVDPEMTVVQSENRTIKLKKGELVVIMQIKSFLTIFLILSFTILLIALALATSAFITEHSSEIYAAVVYAIHTQFPKGRDMLLEVELFSMIAGVFIILAVLLVTSSTQQENIS